MSSEASAVVHMFQPELDDLVKRLQNYEGEFEEREKKFREDQEHFDQLKKNKEEELKLAMDVHNHKMRWEKEKLKQEQDSFVEAQSRGEKLSREQEPVTVEVGGEKFRTLLGTLAKCKGSMFPKLVEGISRKESDENQRGKRDPYIFIDRDSQHFKFILNYLRQGEEVMRGAAMRNPDKFKLKDILTETEYYKIHDLQQLVKRKLISCDKKVNFVSLTSKHFQKLQNHEGFVSVRELTFENYNFDEIEFDKVYFRHPVRFRNCVMTSAKFNECNFMNAIHFNNVDMHKAHFENCRGLPDKFCIMDTDMSHVTANPPVQWQ